jgi:hypothetical protein
LDRAPIANRDEPFRSTDAFGGDGIGEEPPASGAGPGIVVVNVGGGRSVDEFVGVPSMCSGVRNSANVPFSVSSLQRTPRLALDGDFFFIGEN